jgi:hypothetical protein
MADPELLISLIPDKFFKNPIGDVKEQRELEKRFALIVRGYEGFDLSKFFSSHKFYFELVLQDMLKCISCDGNCKTNAGNGIYQGLDYINIKFYGGTQPVFQLFNCPGVTQRKLDIKNQISDGKLNIPVETEESKQCSKNKEEMIAQCKAKLQIQNKVLDLNKKREEREESK